MDTFCKGGTETGSARTRILMEANENITGQRDRDYGSPENNFSIIAHLWTDYL